MVEISAEAKVYYKKQVKMAKADYEKYLAICEEWSGDVDEQISVLAEEYSFFADSDDFADMDAPENIEFRLVINK